MNGDSEVWARFGMYQVGIRHRVIVTRSQVICHHSSGQVSALNRGWLSIYRATAIRGGGDYFADSNLEVCTTIRIYLWGTCFFFMMIADTQWGNIRESSGV